MPPRKKPDVFVEPIEDVEEYDNVVVDEPVTVTSTDSDYVNARVKGTWKMFWGQESYDFKDGSRYKIPKDLYTYLRKSGNIYDTL